MKKLILTRKKISHNNMYVTIADSESEDVILYACHIFVPPVHIACVPAGEYLCCLAGEYEIALSNCWAGGVIYDWEKAMGDAMAIALIMYLSVMVETFMLQVNGEGFLEGESGKYHAAHFERKKGRLSF